MSSALFDHLKGHNEEKLSERTCRANDPIQNKTEVALIGYEALWGQTNCRRQGVGALLYQSRECLGFVKPVRYCCGGFAEKVSHRGDGCNKGVDEETHCRACTALNNGAL